MAYTVVWQEKASYIARYFSELLTLCFPPLCQRPILKPDQLCDLLYPNKPHKQEGDKDMGESQ